MKKRAPLQEITRFLMHPQPCGPGHDLNVSERTRGIHAVNQSPASTSKVTKMSVLTETDAVDIWLRHWAGEFQHHIAASYGVNQGRISEIITGKRFPASERIAAERLGD